MMISRTGNLAGSRILLRCAVLLLAVYTLLPAQLVWCFEDEAAPRLESSLNEQCLPQDDLQCCSRELSVAHYVLATTPTEHSILSAPTREHTHCNGCSDLLAHEQYVTHLAKAATGTPEGRSPGLIFCLTARALEVSGLPIRSAELNDLLGSVSHTIREIKTTNLLI